MNRVPARRSSHARQSTVALFVMIAGVCLPASTGCYDAASLAQSRKDAASGMKLVEVDLGSYRVTLPRPPGEGDGGVLFFHVFGQVANRDRKKVIAEVSTRDPELRHRMLTAVRQLNVQQVEEPQLHTLKDGIIQVVNATLEEELVQNVGFLDFSFTPL